MSSVIVIGAVVGAVVGGGSSILGIRKGNNQLIKAFNKQMKYMQMNYNYNQNALDRQEKGAYDSAISELFNLSLNAYQNNASVNAALNEQHYTGRSARQISRSVAGQTARQKSAIKDAYEEGVYNIRSQKDALYIQMKAGVQQARDNLNRQFTKGLSAVMQVADGAAKGAAIGAVTAGAGSAAAGAAGGAVGGTSGTLVTAGTSAIEAGGVSSMGGTIAGSSLAGTSAAGMGMGSSAYWSTFASSFGKNAATGFGNTYPNGSITPIGYYNMFHSFAGNTYSNTTYGRGF